MPRPVPPPAAPPAAVPAAPPARPAAAPPAEPAARSAGLPLTGERTAPGHPREGYWFARHVAGYAWAAAELRRAGAGAGGRPGGAAGPPVVVEAGSGEGYGAAALRAAGAAVVAVELDAASCAHAARAYPDVPVVRADLARLPLAAGRADAVVSLQVLEHLWDVPGFLAGCRRALRPGGLLLLATPNRPVFSPGLPRGGRPTNPFHVEEFDADQLAAALRAHGWEQVEVAGLHHGPRLRAREDRRGPLVDAQVAAVLAGSWPADLEEFVATVGADDFMVGRPDGCHDLLARAVAPGGGGAGRGAR